MKPKALVEHIRANQVWNSSEAILKNKREGYFYHRCQ